MQEEVTGVRSSKLSLINEPILLEHKGSCNKFKIYIQAAINKLRRKKPFSGRMKLNKTMPKFSR